MINFNGTITAAETNLLVNNRAFLYGDGVFESMKIVDQKVLFLEDHYFRLMASMRICRMEIPMNFTMEYFEEQIINNPNVAFYFTDKKNELKYNRKSCFLKWFII
jgi:branched-chain amino acid aminotransferase